MTAKTGSIRKPPNLSNHRILPVLSLLVTATLWGLVWYPLRLLDSAGMSGVWVSLVSYGAALALRINWLWRSAAEWREDGLYLGLMALGVGWCNVAFILAVLDGTVVRVLLLFYLTPLWALILGWLLLGEKPGRRGLQVFAVAAVGAVIMLWDPAMGAPWPRRQADWLAVSSGFAFAFANVMVRRMRAVSLESKSAANWLGVVVVAALCILILAEPVPQVAVPVWAGAVLLGWFGFMIMTITVIYGVTHMPLHRSAVILLFELVVGAVSALLLTDERVMPQEWIGGALILLAAWLAARAHVGEAQ